MFFVSKLLALFTHPLVWVGLLLLLAVWLIPRRPAVAQRVLLAAVSLSLLIGWTPLPDALLRNLENRFDPPQGTLDSYVGLVVLGGALEAPHFGRTLGAGPVSNVNERLTVAVALMRQYGHLRLLYLGGEDMVKQVDGERVNKAQVLFTRLGLDSQRVTYEDASRNTYENAMLGGALPGVDKTQRWLLVTSARHMPRSLATFRTAGWNVTPYPVDYLSSGTSTEWTKYSLASGVLHWQVALREYVSGLAYILLGRANPLR